MRKPKILVSKCLDFNNCRYDGQGYRDKVVLSLKDHVDIITVCPEVEIGLGTPRDPIKIEIDKNSGNYKLVQHKTNKDCTKEMKDFSNQFLSTLEDIDGFILKSKSPSCGLKDVKIYNEGNKCSIKNNGNGLFCDEVIALYGDFPIESDGRLSNYSTRDNFLTKIFLLNNLKSTNNIIKFNEENKLLLESYCKEGYKKLSELISNDILTEEVINDYKNEVYKIIKNKRNKESKLSIIESVFNRYIDKLNDEEINMFKDIIKSFENNKIPFSALGLAIKIFATRFEDREILSQSFFNPYPESLISISDSGKGRDL